MGYYYVNWIILIKLFGFLLLFVSQSIRSYCDGESKVVNVKWLSESAIKTSPRSFSPSFSQMQLDFVSKQKKFDFGATTWKNGLANDAWNPFINGENIFLKFQRIHFLYSSFHCIWFRWCGLNKSLCFWLSYPLLCLKYRD